MKAYKKQDFPVSDIRRFLEPGPVVLVSSAWKGERNIMTMGWHTVLEFSPSLIGCMISSGNHSHDLIRQAKECVINVPTVDIARTVVGIGNCSGASVDKFKKFKVTVEDLKSFNKLESDRKRLPSNVCSARGRGGMIECGHKLNCAHNFDYGHKNSTSHIAAQARPLQTT